MIETKLSGPDDLLQEINNALNAPEITVGYDAPGYRSDGVAHNVVLRTHRKGSELLPKRNPWIVLDTETERGLAIATEIINAWLARSPVLVKARAEELARYMIGLAIEHINAGVGEHGRLAPLSETTKRLKKWKYKVEGKPILVRTGQLLSALKTVVRIKGMRF